MISSALLYLLVSISGAAVLSLEILGTRVLGPYFGVSLFLWSALITVTLAALSVGYALGGRLADRGPKLSLLGGILGLAGIWVLLIPLLKNPLLDLTGGLELRAAVLSSSLVLFAPPLTLLGMVSPYVLRLKARNMDHLGRDAGDLFAVSTVASVVSALATGFWLIPSLGVARLITLVGVLLLVAAGLAFVAARRNLNPKFSVAVCCCLALAGLAGIASQMGASAHPVGLLYHHDSPYAEIRVLDRDDGRYLLLDGGVHTIAGHGGGRSLHRYVPVFESCRMLFEEPGRVLLLGLGGGVVARSFYEAGWEVDAVEIDPDVVDVAYRYFQLGENEAQVHTMDARRFLSNHHEEWDLILVDAFGSSSIPFHLVTEEFFALIRDRLSPFGLVAMNVESRAWHDELIGSIGHTLLTSFPVVWALPTAEPPSTLGNVILVASEGQAFHLLDEELPNPQEFLHDDDEHWRAVQIVHAWDNAYMPLKMAGVVLSDDRNPVDLWSDAVNREARQDLREYFGDDPALH